MVLFARWFTWLSLALPLTVAAQEIPTHPHYVVIGAFANADNAVDFTDEAKHHQYPARFEMNLNRHLYYVYVLATDDRALAVAEAIRLQTETKYFDAWVYSGWFGDVQHTNPENTGNEDFDPVTDDVISVIALDEDEQRPGRPVDTDITFQADRTGDAMRNGMERNEIQRVSQAGDSTVTMRAIKDSAEDTIVLTELIPAPKRASVDPLKAEDIIGKNFYFHLFRSDNGVGVAGEVDAIDFEQSRRMATYPANESVAVRMPAGKSKRISFLCQVFGYRKQQREFDPASVDADLYFDDKGNIVVPFELVRLQKGDIAIMYNVFFFKDAAVMRPESRYEVNNLLELLKENPSYKIIIHGHTNGNAGGKIIRMSDPENFYSLSGTKEGFGSARRLSEERALVMRKFLVSSGIPEERMQVKAWGGKKPIHDKRSVRASENVRVEIEILSGS